MRPTHIPQDCLLPKFPGACTQRSSSASPTWCLQGSNTKHFPCDCATCTPAPRPSALPTKQRWGSNDNISILGWGKPRLSEVRPFAQHCLTHEQQGDFSSEWLSVTKMSTLSPGPPSSQTGLSWQDCFLLPQGQRVSQGLDQWRWGHSRHSNLCLFCYGSSGSTGGPLILWPEY